MNPNVKTANRHILAYAAAMCLACVLIAFNAHAGDQGHSQTVKFADLDLGTQAGAEALYGRIHMAARRVCLQPAGETEATGPCIAKAEGEAIRKVNAPLLTAFYQKKTGSYPQTVTASR